MFITLESVDKPQYNAEKKYYSMDVYYVVDGEQKSQKLVSFGPGKAVFEMLKTAGGGDIFEIKLEKNGKYWNWVGARRAEDKPATVASGGTATKQGRSTFETPEERASRQVLIVRQSSLANAVSYCQFANPKATVDQLLEIAECFTDFVFEKELVFEPKEGSAEPEAEAPKASKGKKVEKDDIPW